MTRMITLICLILFIPTPILAQAIVVTDTSPTLSTAPYLSILEDPGQQLTVEQATSADTLSTFTPYLDNIRDLGLKDSAWWLRLDIQRDDTIDTDWYAQFTVPMLTAESDAYFLSDKHPTPVPLSNMQEKPSELRLYTLKLPKLKQFTLILRLNNHGDALIHFPLQLLNTEQLYKSIATDHFLYGGIMLSLLVLATYNLFLFFSLRHYAYLTLVIYLLASILLVQKATNAIPALSFLQDPTTFYHAFSIQLILITAVQFWRQLTESKELFPRLDKIAWYQILFMIGITPFISFLPYSNAWSLTLVTLVLFTITPFCIFAIKKRPSTAISLFLSFITTIISAVPITICSFGFFLDKVEIALDIYNIGVLCATVLLSFTLVEHTRQLRIQARRSKTESAAKDNFLTTMSHELRTPMHAVNSVVHLFKSTPLSDKQKIYLNKLEISADHVLSLINQILDLGRINSSEFILETHPFQLSETLQQVSQLLTEEAEQKQLAFNIENHAHIPPGKSLICDATRLKQVLLNLLHNAIKFTEKGSVTLTIENTSDVPPSTNTVSLQFRVTDTGIGIPQEQHQSIFHAFSQVDNSTQRKYGGSGLGLAISHKLVNQMGGALKLNSTPGQGSCFFFTITYLLHDDSTDLTIATPPRPEAQHKQAKITVMLVDDVQLNRFLGGELLKMLGVNAITVGSGEEALQTLRQQTQPTIDLVLMDVSMPGMDGYEATRQIRSETRFADLSVVALTAHAIEGERERCLASGMNDYLSKPFELEQLQEKIQRWTHHLPQ